MEFKQTELADLVCTRISHDLIGNIGALAGALELIQENNGVTDEDTMSILSTASDTLKARQKFFRVAFGVDGKSMTSEDIRQICDDYLHSISGRNTALKLKPGRIPPELAKVWCLCVMIGAEVCIKGGEVDVRLDGQKLVIGTTSGYKLAAGKIAVYQEIAANQMPQENVSQYVHLLYLRAYLGKNVPLKVAADENSMIVTIG